MDMGSVRRLALAFGAGLAVTLATSAWPVAAQEKTYSLRFAEMASDRGPRSEAIIWWADEINKRTNGAVTVEFFWGQSLVKGKDIMKSVGVGLVEIGSVYGNYSPAEMPLWELGAIPFAISDVWVGVKTWAEMRKTVPALKEEAERQNIHILNNFSSGPVDILSRTPITTTADLAGKKIRSNGGWLTLLKDLGASPVSLGYGEVYQALERGTIDASTAHIPLVKSYKFFEVGGHLTESRMGQILNYGMGINLDVWKSMPEDIRVVITEVSDEFLDVFAEKSMAADEKVKQELTAGIDGRKVEFHKLDDATRKEWQAKAEPQVQEWIKKVSASGVDGQAIYAKHEEIRAKYEKELQEKGYPWKR